MLKLKNIYKDYYVGSETVKALSNINLSFRKNEFVAVTGPSGSGKTTLLNLIGGLDVYTKGNLLINNIPTDKYKEKDWNNYRSNKVGFVFQSYNLIEHQSILANVELSLNIAGVSRLERTKRAKKALDDVGLKGQYHKKPNQLSGGQSQRVAIARALVNNPEIILADEPTGALDSKTSKEVLNIIKDISKERLVIMVTHNEELANMYATRKITLFDGFVTNDTNPYLDEKEEKITNNIETTKTKMSFLNIFKLSFKNLITKINRTFITSLALAIGLLGISLVLALSTGVNKFVTYKQEDILSSNPLIVSNKRINLNNVFNDLSLGEKIDFIIDANEIGLNPSMKLLADKVKNMNYSLINQSIDHNYINYINNMPKDYISTIHYDRQISISNNVYVNFINEKDEEIKLSISALRSIMAGILSKNEETLPYSTLLSLYRNIIKEFNADEKYVEEQYELLAGKMPENKNELILVLNKDSLIDDLVLAQLGILNQKQFQNAVFKELKDDKYDESIEIPNKIKFDEIIGRKMYFHDNDAIYKKIDINYYPPFMYEPYLKDVSSNNNSLVLEIVGIMKLKDNFNYGVLESGIYYTNMLTDHFIDANETSKIINYLDNNKQLDGEFRVALANNPTLNNQQVVFYFYEYSLLGVEYKDQIGFVGKFDEISFFKTSKAELILTKRDLGGERSPSKISIYPKDLTQKENVIKYLNNWNINNKDNEFYYIDDFSLFFEIIYDVVKILTLTMIVFTSLALFVSSFLIGITSYVSVIERTNEIGVIRSLGGSRNNVSSLFLMEGFIIGLISSLITIIITIIISVITNKLLYNLLGYNITSFNFRHIVILLSISILTTLISGFIPSRIAAKLNPVDALRI